MTTYMANPEDIERKRCWFVVDADGKTLGRLASEIAKILRGKHKVIYTPNMDTGDNVIVVNAEKIKLTGKKLQQKMHHKHSEYPGGLKSVSYEELLSKQPEKVMKLAVKGMLPKNKLGRKMMKKLKVYAGSDHPHQAQEPEELDI
jgi:large subunit ribosomal protein L13